jgi:hypothetical protein
MHPRQLSQTIPCISRTVVGQQGHSLLQASMPDDEERECAPSKRKFLHWTPRVSQLFRAHHGLLNVQSFQQGESDSGPDILELPTAGTAHPAPAPVQGPRMHVLSLRY